MKAIIFIFLSLIISLEAQSQFFNIGDKWIYDTRDYTIGGGFYSEKFDSIEIISDTLINGQQYYHLLATEDNPCGVFTNNEYLREEEGKIYRLSKNFEDENLMIDFAPQDSYVMSYQASWFNSEIQTNVINDSTGIEVLPSGQALELTYQRIINNSSFSNSVTYKLSREVGYIQYGFLFPDIGTGLCDGKVDLNLRCKTSANDTIKVTDLDCYESSIKTSNQNIETIQYSVYPNPTEGVVTLKGDIKNVCIRDMKGNLLTVPLQNNTLDISHYPSGMYMLYFENNEGRVALEKIIKR